MSSDLTTRELLRNPSSDSQRLPAQVFREQWEAQWIAEQRKASDVVRYAQFESSAHGRTQEPPAGGNGHRAAPSAVADTASLNGAVASRLTVHDGPASLGSNASAAGARHSTAGGQPNVSEQFAARGIEAAAHTPGVGASARAIATTAHSPLLSPMPPRRYAIWRDGDSVRIAMRLEEPTKADGMATVLRGWLRAAGLTLRQLLINGKNQGDDHGH